MAEDTPTTSSTDEPPDSGVRDAVEYALEQIADVADATLLGLSRQRPASPDERSDQVGALLSAARELELELQRYIHGENADDEGC